MKIIKNGLKRNFLIHQVYKPNNFRYIYFVAKLKLIRDYLGVIWALSLLFRIIGKITGIYEIPDWFKFFVFATIAIIIVLSVFIYFNKKASHRIN